MKTLFPKSEGTKRRRTATKLTKRRASLIVCGLTLLLCLVGGCTTSFPYVPNRPPVPLLTHRGELNVSGGLHFPQSTGFDYEVAYAMSDHYSIYGAYQFDRGQGSGWNADDSSDYHNRFFELGVGRFDSISDWGHAETFALGGIGSGFSHNFPRRFTSSASDTTSLTPFRFGLQENLGIEGSVGAFGIGLGLGVQHMFGFNRSATAYNSAPNGDLSVASHIQQNSPLTSLYAEPVIFWRLGFRSVRVMQEVWFSFVTGSSSFLGSANESLTICLDF